MREFKLPEGFAPTADKSTGIRDNLAFEDLAIAPSGDVFVAIEAALYQDGPAASLVNGSLARIIRYDGTTGEPKAQYVYPISPIPQAAAKADGGNDNCMSEIIALDGHRLLAIERSYAQGAGNNVKIYMISTVLQTSRRSPRLRRPISVWFPSARAKFSICVQPAVCRTISSPWRSARRRTGATR
jgi:hypothetical protein